MEQNTDGSQQDWGKGNIGKLGTGFGMGGGLASIVFGLIMFNMDSNNEHLSKSLDIVSNRLDRSEERRNRYSDKFEEQIKQQSEKLDKIMNLITQINSDRWTKSDQERSEERQDNRFNKRIERIEDDFKKIEEELRELKRTK